MQRLLDAMGELPAKDGWLLRELHVLSGRDAAIAVMDQKEPLANCNAGQPLLLIGRNRVLSTGYTSGYSLRFAPNGTLLWDLRGDGPRFLVIEEHLCNFASTTRVHGIDENGEWALWEDDAIPSCVTCPRPKEEMPDGKPLFSRYVVSLLVASGGPYFPTSADVYLIEAWDGQRFRTNLPVFAPFYEKRLAASREAGKRARARGSASCNVDVFTAAAEIYVYSRVLGKNEPAALAEADRLVQGISTKPCEQNHEGSMYGTQRYAWADMREQLIENTRDLQVMQSPSASAPRP